MKYDYTSVMEEDIREAISNYDLADYPTKERAFEALYDGLWIDDSVTGNASGSYYCNSGKAEEAVEGNLDLLARALIEFGYEDKTMLEKIRDEEWEWCDVTIRCYLLGKCLGEVLDDVYEEEVI